jgi:subtilisin family serine protease
MSLSMRRLLVPSFLAVLVAATVGLTAGRGADAGARTIVALRATSTAAQRAALHSAGGRVVDAKLRLWEVASDARVLAELRQSGDVAFTQPVKAYAVTGLAATHGDPLSDREWWRAEIGVAGLTPPGAGVPVTVVDSGLDLVHPEFAGRIDTTALNAQEPQPFGGEHGTMVSSLIAAPENGVGVVGIYPLAVLRSWDAAQGQGTRLDSPEIVNGILAAARSGTGVVNLSLGGQRDLAIDLAVQEAVSLGSLIVAASGNEGDEGNELSYPAALPHVLTVAATGRDGQITGFSSTSNYVDIAAPGDDITVASALGNNWTTSSGTSFSAPLVSGAAAWVWTARPTFTADQVAEVLRRSARDLGAPGRDTSSGFGMLNVAAALAAPTPVADRGEPNDDVDNVNPDGERNFSNQAPLTTKTVRRATISARLDRWEDPADVYRVWLPARRSINVTSSATTDTDLTLYRTGVPSIAGKFISEYRLTRARTQGKVERLRFVNGATGRWAYLAVSPGRSAGDATYRLAVAVNP